MVLPELVTFHRPGTKAETGTGSFRINSKASLSIAIVSIRIAFLFEISLVHADKLQMLAFQSVPNQHSMATPILG
jgi:hypothetical protein